MQKKLIATMFTSSMNVAKILEERGEPLHTLDTCVRRASMRGFFQIFFHAEIEVIETHCFLFLFDDCLQGHFRNVRCQEIYAITK